MAADSASGVRCAFVGDEPLAAQCVEIAREHGLDTVLLATTNTISARSSSTPAAETERSIGALDLGYHTHNNVGSVRWVLGDEVFVIGAAAVAAGSSGAAAGTVVAVDSGGAVVATAELDAGSATTPCLPWPSVRTASCSMRSAIRPTPAPLTGWPSRSRRCWPPAATSGAVRPVTFSLFYFAAGEAAASHLGALQGSAPAAASTAPAAVSGTARGAMRRRALTRRGRGSEDDTNS